MRSAVSGSAVRSDSDHYEQYRQTSDRRQHVRNKYDVIDVGVSIIRLPVRVQRSRKTRRVVAHRVVKMATLLVNHVTYDVRADVESARREGEFGRRTEPVFDGFRARLVTFTNNTDIECNVYKYDVIDRALMFDGNRIRLGKFKFHLAPPIRLRSRARY